MNKLRIRTRQRKRRFIGGLHAITRVEDAYKGREYFLKKLKTAKSPGFFRSWLSGINKQLDLGLTAKQIERATWRLSSNVLAINIFMPASKDIPYLPYSGESHSIRNPAGLLYFNIIYVEGQGPEQKKLMTQSAVHEEAHVTTSLQRDSRGIKSITDVKEYALRELISLLTECKSVSEYHKQKDDLRSILGYALFAPFLKLSKEYPKRYSAKREKAVLDKRSINLDAISEVLTKTTKNPYQMPLGEVLMVLRQCSWDSVPQALRERMRARNQYLLKRKNK